MTEHEPLLEVRDLRVEYPSHRAGNREHVLRAVDGVSLRLARGETLGLVGESGSGKSTIGNAILGLVKPAAGHILFMGQDITHAKARQRRNLAEHLQVVFQDPYSSLNPSRTIGQTLSDPLRVTRRMSRAAAAVRVTELLGEVGMSPDASDRYPAQFSGGQRQRIAIARALMLEPDVVVCDEPTSSLDLSVQAQVINLLVELQEKLGLSYLFVSHDISVIRHVSHRVAVLLKGHIVEHGPVDIVTENPSHPYTQALLAATPVPDPGLQASRRRGRNQSGPKSVARQEPAQRLGLGCPFVDRCPSAMDICRRKQPALEAGAGGAHVACHLHSATNVSIQPLSAAIQTN
jgi:oligopeptide/dipeptide ABC transporter ATP-binding protein